jgi:hypothetical protein
MVTPSGILVWSFAALALLVGAAFPVGLFAAMRRLGSGTAAAARAAALAGAGTAVWMAITLAAAASGRLAFGPMPPPVGILFVLILAGAGTLGLSRVGERLALGLPLALLVGAQGFRLPLEILMHRAHVEGVMPVQMSYAGLNFDVLTGVGALVVATLLALGRMPRWGVWAWNLMGSLLLLNILVVAWLSAPTPLRLFMNEPANVWITHPPFVWLPSVLVLTAILGHIVVFRRLRAEARQGARSTDRVVAEREAVAAGVPPG